MKVDEISLTLPNGFHDATLVNINVSYAERTATLHLGLWIGTMDQPAGELRERQAKATLLLTGLQYCVIEPPAGSPLLNEHDLSTVDGFVTNEHTESWSVKPPQLGPGCSAYSLFAYNWNACIHLGYSSAVLTYDDVADALYVQATMSDYNGQDTDKDAP